MRIDAVYAADFFTYIVVVFFVHLLSQVQLL
jgi:hypothetical protein